MVKKKLTYGVLKGIWKNNILIEIEEENSKKKKEKFKFFDDFSNGNTNNWDLTNAKIEYNEIKIIGDNFDMDMFNTSTKKLSSDFNEKFDFLIETEIYFTKKGKLNDGSGLIFFSNKAKKDF